MDVLYTRLGLKKKTSEFPINYKRSLLVICAPRLGRQKIKLTSISAGTKPCELFCAVVHRASSTALTSALWTDHIRKPMIHHPWWSVQDASDLPRNHSKTLFQWRLVLSSVPVSKTFKTSFEHTFISKFGCRILCMLVHEISYCQRHLWSFFSSPSQFLVSLFQHCVRCTQWLVDQL